MKVLIPVEDESFANEIFKFVNNHSWPEKTQFKIINVHEPVFIQEAVSPVVADELVAYLESCRAEGQALVDEFGQKIKMRFPDCQTECTVMEGFAKNAILNQIKRWQPDLVVMGSHSKGAIERFVLGSVSMAVLSMAKCSTVIIKSGSGCNHDSIEQKSSNSYSQKESNQALTKGVV